MEFEPDSHVREGEILALFWFEPPVAPVAKDVQLFKFAGRL